MIPISFRKDRGFALIVTISMMILLSLLAVGLLSLSTITLRGGRQGAAMAEARANARMALMLAIGELQKEFGPDQRISASASILESPASSDDSGANGHWVGSWDSWKGENRYLSKKHSAAMLVPDHSAHREDSFRRWLVSAGDPKSLATLGFAKSAPSDDAVLLVGPGTLGADAKAGREVRAPRVLMPGRSEETGGTQGAFSWWVGDESQKGYIRAGRSEEDLSEPEQVVAETESASSVAEELFKPFSAPADADELRRGSVSRETLGLMDSASNVGSAFHDLTVDARSVLTDVREGGLKRDLNLLAEGYEADYTDRDGLPLEEEFMLYDFGELNRVPLHDLLTYYSLYKVKPKGSVGALVSSGQSKPYTTNISVGEWRANPDGMTTNLYRQPVLVKTQLAIWARSERSGTNPKRPYRLKFRFTPIITMWNPYNVPLTLNRGSGGTRITLQGISADMAVWPTYQKGNDRGRESSSLGGLTSGLGDEANSSETLASMVIRKQVKFLPGEVRVFSLDSVQGDLAQVRELKPGYWPISGNEVDYYDLRVSRGGAVDATYDSDSVTFTPTQIIGVGFAGGTEDTSVTDLKLSQGVSVEVRPDYPGSETSWRTQALYSRRSPDKNPDPRTTQDMNRFNQNVFELGSQLDGEEMRWRTGTGSYIRKPYSIRNLESAEGEMVGVFTYGVAGEAEVLSYTIGRYPRFPCRPFLHSLPTVGSPWIQDITNAALYNLGWAWRIEDGQESSNEIVVDGVQGRFGGGWSAAYGQARVVQYELPQRPFHSLAQFANAALGGWSVARNHPTETSGGLKAHETTTAAGQGGLFPAVSMPIGNSYAHPLIPQDQAFTEWNMRKYHGGERSEPFVDHSYLANYALWDEYFMSSIADETTGLHSTGQFQSRRMGQVAEEFFGPDHKPLPNQRFVPATDEPWDDLKENLFRGSRATKTTDNAYEVVARYLLLEGGFNVNSTSVEAWTALLGSLRGKPAAILPGDSDALKFKLEAHDGRTPVPGFSIATGDSIDANSGLRGDSYDPEQWVGSFTLGDDEVKKLAEALVEQVKLRGPFLSLSDFVNRSLGGDAGLAKWGALQAAIEDAGLNSKVVSSRSGELARTSEFMRRNKLRDTERFPFREAGEGAVIQGSAAYIDQADVLRAIDSQLVPRGDTFVVRTCGESVDSAGKVLARAFCEAVVQRLPEYLDPKDEPETRTDELEAKLNQQFGRKLQVTSFRWLSPEEV